MLFEVDEAATRIRDEADQDANIIIGASFDESLEGIVRVSVVAAGIDSLDPAPHTQPAEAHLQSSPAGCATTAVRSPDRAQYTADRRAPHRRVGPVRAIEERFRYRPWLIGVHERRALGYFRLWPSSDVPGGPKIVCS